MKLNYKRTVFVGMAFLSICAFWQLYDQVVPLMLKNTFGLGETASGAIMAIDNVLALFLLPFFGALSDGTRTRLGRRMPYIIVGTLLAAVMMVLLPYADYLRMLPMYIAVLFVLLVSMAIYRSPAVALMPDVTPKPLRSQGNAVINLMGALGGMTALVLIWLLVPERQGMRDDYQMVFIAVAALMVVSLIILLCTIRENKFVKEMTDIHYGVDPFTEDAAQVDNTGKERLTPELRRSLLLILFSVALWYMGYNAVTSAYSRYAQEIWGQNVGTSSLGLLVANGGAMAAFIPVGHLASKIGRKRMIMIGVMILGISFGITGLFTTYTPFIYVMFVLVGIGWACINVNSYPMVVDLSRGASVGKYTGYYYTFSMAAQIITPVISGFLLEKAGYWTLFPYAAITVLLAFATMAFVRHGDNRPKKPQTNLEIFNNEED